MTYSDLSIPKKTMEKIQYKGYTIEEDFDRNPYSRKPEFMFYPTEQGAQHDYDGDSEGYKYCGNCKWADDLEEAQIQIDELVEMAQAKDMVLLAESMGFFGGQNAGKPKY